MTSKVSQSHDEKTRGKIENKLYSAFRLPIGLAVNCDKVHYHNTIYSLGPTFSTTDIVNY